MDRKTIDKTFVRQHDSTDCGAACLLSVIKYHGGDSSIRRIRDLSGTSQRGTTMLGLYQAARRMGLEAEGVESDSLQELACHGKPCILVTLIDGRYSHYMVLYGYEKGLFIIGDPARGVSEYAPEELSAIWTGKCLIMEPGKGFVRNADIRKGKREWMASLVREDVGILAVCTLIGIVLSVLGMIMAVFSQKLVDEILPSRDMSKLLWGIGMLLFLLLARACMDALRSRMLIMQSCDFNNRIIGFFFKRLLALPKSFFDNRKTGDLTARLNDTRRIQTVVSNIAGDALINVLMIAVSVVFIAVYSWKIAIVSIVSLPLFFAIIYRSNRTVVRRQTEVMGAYAMTESGFVNTIAGVPAIKSFGREDFFYRLNLMVYSLFQEKVCSLGKTQISIGMVSGITGILIMTGIIAYGSVMVFEGSMSTGELMAVLSISGSLFPSVASLATVVVPVNEAKVALDRMFEITGPGNESEDTVNSPSCMKSVDSLALEDVTFRFTGCRKILDSVSLYFRKGEINCIVGESGCGKSTLLQIVQGFYAAESGRIKIDGVQVAGRNPGLIASVPQDIYVFNGTVMENICFGTVPESVESVEDFCRGYGFDAFIDRLPDGLMTIVGEEGINLSGGQRQLIAFARALYNSSAEILLIDEMTSAMDRNLEKAVCGILNKIKDRYIIVFATHRLETAKMISDHIYVIEDAVVRAAGTHDELMASRNFYSEYWRQS